METVFYSVCANSVIESAVKGFGKRTALRLKVNDRSIINDSVHLKKCFYASKVPHSSIRVSQISLYPPRRVFAMNHLIPFSPESNPFQMQPSRNLFNNHRPTCTSFQCEKTHTCISIQGVIRGVKGRLIEGFIVDLLLS